MEETCVYAVSDENPEWLVRRNFHALAQLSLCLQCPTIVNLQCQPCFQWWIFPFSQCAGCDSDTSQLCRTSCKTTARVTSPVRIGDVVENFGIERFKANSEKAKQAVMHALDKLRLGSVSFMEGAEPVAPPSPGSLPPKP